MFPPPCGLISPFMTCSPSRASLQHHLYKSSSLLFSHFFPFVFFSSPPTLFRHHTTSFFITFLLSPLLHSHLSFIIFSKPPSLLYLSYASIITFLIRFLMFPSPCGLISPFITCSPSCSSLQYHLSKSSLFFLISFLSFAFLRFPPCGLT